MRDSGSADERARTRCGGALFHQAYPHAPQDAHLANRISDIAAQAD